MDKNRRLDLFCPSVILMFNVLLLLSEYSVVYKAGSSEDNILADKIHEYFASQHMKTWVDEHFVKLQYPSRSVVSL